MTRREFTEKVKRQIRARSGGHCEHYMMPYHLRDFFPLRCTRPAAEIDHIYPDKLETDEAKQVPLTHNEGADLCKLCHAIKTTHDRKAMARRNKHVVNKNRPKKNKRPQTVIRPKQKIAKSSWGNPEYKRTVGGKVIKRRMKNDQ